MRFGCRSDPTAAQGIKKAKDGLDRWCDGIGKPADPCVKTITACEVRACMRPCVIACVESHALRMRRISWRLCRPRCFP